MMFLGRMLYFEDLCFFGRLWEVRVSPQCLCLCRKTPYGLVKYRGDSSLR